MAGVYALSLASRQELQQRWDAALWAAEAPLRQLLELSLSSAPGELLELLGPLRRALVDAPLPGSSATLQGAVKLRKALEARRAFCEHVEHR